MADVLSSSGALDPRGPRVLATVPEARVSAEQITGPMSAIAASVGALGKTVEEATASWQRDQGAASVTRGPDGQIQMQTRPFEFGRGDREANAAARQGALAMWQADAARGYADLHTKHQTDAPGFLAAAKSFTNDLTAKLPRELRPLGMQQAESLISQHHVAIQNTTANAATTNEKTALETQVASRINDLSQLARQGGTSTPEFLKAEGELRDLYGALVRNPRFGVPRVKADEDIARIGDTMKFEAITGQADRIFDERGSVGAREELRKQLAQPGSHMTDSDRARITTAFESRIAVREGQRKQEIEVNRKSLDALVEATTKGRPIPPGAWDAPIANADRLGDAEGGTKAKMYRLLFGTGGSLSGATAMPDGARAILRGAGTTITGMTQPAGPVRGLGDSYGEGAGGKSPLSLVGANPADVLRTARANAASLAGQTIAVGTGLINQPTDTASVEAAVQTLKTAGVKPVIALVADGARARDGTTSEVINTRLREIGAKLGVPVAASGPVGSDGIHPADGYRTLKANVGGGGDGPATAAPAVGGTAGAGTAAFQHIPRVNEAMSFYTSRGYSRIAAAAIVGNLLHESGMKTEILGDRTIPGGSVGLGQWNRERQANLKAFAAARGKSFTDFQTQLEFVEHELNTSEGKWGAALKSAKSAEEANAAMISFERPAGWTEYNPTGGHGWGSRLNNTRAILGQPAVGVNVAPGSSGGGGRPASPVPMNAYTLPAYLGATGIAEEQKIKFVTGLAGDVLTGLKHGQLPSAEHGALIEQVASQHPGSELAKKALEVAAQLAGAQITDEIGNMAPAAGQQRLSEIRTRAASSGDLWEQAVGRTVEEWQTRREKRMKDDPITAGAEDRGWYAPVAPIDFRSPESIARGVAEHGNAALALTSHQGAPHAAFSGAGLSAVKDRLANGDIGQRLAILQAVTQLPPEIMRATLSKIANDDEGKVFAIAGSVSRFAPDVARDIVQGQAELKDEKKLAPKDDATLADVLSKRLPLTDFPVEARGALKAAALALYARGSAKANDTSTTLNESRLDAALTAVTGGLLDSRGTKIIAPAYGMRQEEFDGLVRGLTDEDFAGARLGDGSRFPASALKPAWGDSFRSGGWRLQSYGEGRYLVVSGSSDAPRPLMQAMSDTSGAGGGPFILDLRTRRAPAPAPRRPDASMAPSWPAMPVDMVP